jgi:hypothetical protein
MPNAPDSGTHGPIWISRDNQINVIVVHFGISKIGNAQ